MKLKDYQSETLKLLNQYLLALRENREKARQVAALGLNIPVAWDTLGWQEVRGEARYLARKNGNGEPLPNVCFKIPTGGGKTLLAIKALDSIYSQFLRRKTGLTLWIVPNDAIYRQTLRALKDRSHPYRQELEMIAAGNVKIIEKSDLFSPEDLQAQMVVLLLMLPSANRENRETLKIFQDRGGFEAFFPSEDDYEAHRKLTKQIKNLDLFGNPEGDIPLMGGIVKTSLGNTLRLLNPVIILDEGHKAYSEIAQETLRGFDPCLILELSATPTVESNILVNVSGQALLREGMIKLPINVHSFSSADWHDALRGAHLKRQELEKIAGEHYEQTGEYIRPICLIQVERTGEKQRLPKFVHAEDARDYLIQKCNVLPEQIAVKSSEKDEIEDMDLLDPECPILYIITKQALQEGWDCPFAYVLATLVNAKAPVSMTQLVGRILRQPGAHKTGTPALDESYVFFCKDSTGELIRRVYQSLKQEGLEDIPGGINLHSGALGTEMQEIPIRAEFADYAGRVYLPCFVVPDEFNPGQFREVGYETDILSRIDFEKIDLSLFETLELNQAETGNVGVSIGLDGMESAITVTAAVDLPLDLVFITKQLIDVIPNPWVAYPIAKDVITRLRQRFSDQLIRCDLGFVISELKKLMVKGRDEQAQKAFEELLETGKLHFWLVSGCAGNAIPDRIRARMGRKLRHRDTDQTPQRSLFEYAEEEFNVDEAAVALYLDRQQWVLGWFRNMVKTGYSIQGWQPGRVYPDFVAFTGQKKLEKVRVLEIKGLHLKNDNTDYKKDLFKTCNQYGQDELWDEVAQEFSGHTIDFQVVFTDEWERILNAMWAE
jgi:type III restriction enzyme